MRATPAASIVACLVLLLSWLSVRATNPEAEMFDRALAEIDRFAVLENELYRDVFLARTGTLHNYDPVVREIDALHDAIDRLRSTAAIDAETKAAVDRLAASVDRQEQLAEHFKSENALLHNSLSFFVRFSARQASADLNPAISAAAAAMLQLTLDTSPASAQQLKDQLDQLSQQPALRADAAATLEALVAHGLLLHDLLPSVDNTLRTMRAEPRKLDQDALRTLIMTRETASRNLAREYRQVLYVTSLLLVAFLVHLGLKLKSRANALQRRAAFEHLIARISMRFINARPQDIGGEIDRAIADMAACIGSDRAYFVMSGSTQRVHLWCKPGTNAPAHWPVYVAALATQFDQTADGIVNVPQVDRLPLGEVRSALVRVGVCGWACVTNTGKDGTVASLGFDAIGRACRITAPGELSLLRMALDTILYAVARHSMETERARLESRLRQARRLERIGTFTSGIAHNFNNLLGGILGHSEVMEERLGSDTRVARNLAAIRRGAESAHDLVDQILAFGRHRDVRPRPLNANALITEATSLFKVSLPVGIQVAVHEPPVAAIVSGEPAQLQQVLLNLCSNAAQAVEGSGRIDIGMEVKDLTTAQRFSHDELQPGRYACIAISETGHGMDEATLARIFEPFYTTRSSGNGLGLATVHEIVRDHGGGINVSSTPGQGSHFEVWLPCSPAVETTPNMKAPTTTAGQGETVLMVTSEAALLLRDEETLAALGYEPVGFTAPEAALSACLAKPKRFDILIVGPLGPPAASLELATALHAMATHLPIVLATRATEEIGADALIAAGISDLVRWPIIAEEIAAALAHGLALRETLQRRVPATSSAIRR